MEEKKKSCCLQEPKNLLTLVLILGVLSLGILSILRDGIVNPERNYFNVNAEGKIFMKPDIAQISFGVQTETTKEAVDAVEEGTEKMNKVIKRLKDLKIEGKDIKTTQYNLRPVYSYPEKTGRRELSGYELYQQVTIKIRDLDKIGEIIKESANLGANQIGNVNFTIDNTDELKAQARKQAIEKAKVKAKEIARESGIKLGKIVNVYENNYHEPSFRNDYAYSKDMALGMGGAMMESIPDVKTGEMEVVLNITLVYKVK